MKEVQPLDQDKVTIVKQAQQEKQLKLLAVTKLHKGQTMYEVNLSTGVVKAAEFEEAVASFPVKVKGKGPWDHIERFSSIQANTVRHKVMVNPDCIYVSALNLKNLMKKLRKEGLLTPNSKSYGY